MSQEDRVAAMSLWNGVVVFASLWYLTGSFWKGCLIGLFVLVSCQLGFGAKWLYRGGFAVALFAIAVSLGVPHPSRWGEIASRAPVWVDHARALFSAID